MGAFDWLKRKKASDPSGAPAAPALKVHREGSELVVDDGRGDPVRLPLGSARAVRIVPLSGGSHHTTGLGYQVAMACTNGDIAVGKPSPDWRFARSLADQICQTAELPLDELTEKMFSRVGTFDPKVDV